ncbi:unnamed protein product [Didymodactylos carnosus]|uniref:ACB domain-containing protein n=1 Tax=Didymodactylos carnosus TaxID=1234261 RepID=A0A813PCC4_9BILA|nr:unnamed protein product [Didymodactylos carnosus]CAF0752142.1 unnamed protein product [Didymodactylos carnosus]CAF3495169.1 unnamed protein product [Didymodactylos carnosus]CAF3531912.1 unnamed protein product [Didymodactylos carnosus]
MIKIIHPKITSPNQYKKIKRNNSGRPLLGSGRTIRVDSSIKANKNVDKPQISATHPIDYFELLDAENIQSKAQSHLHEEKMWPIAPDGFIPNSVTRSIFKTKQIEPIERKVFKLKWLDIPENNRRENLDDGEEFVDFDDPEASFISASADKQSNNRKKIRGLTYGIEPTLVNQVLSILLTNLDSSENDGLHPNLILCTIRTIEQFVIERKSIILSLLELAGNSEKDDIVTEAINAVKYITDVNDSNLIVLVLKNMDSVRYADDENFSLKSIVATLRSADEQLIEDMMDGVEQDTTESTKLHPLLKKISQEKWYPKDLLPTIENVVEAILEKILTANKTQLKTFTKYLIELQRNIGFSNELYDRCVEGLVPLLLHNEPDHRSIIANTLGELKIETKTADIALLNAYVNDKRVLVRTECCEALKKLSGIQSDTVLKDIADDIDHLETLPSAGFSLQNYFNQKRMPVEAEGDQQEQQQNETKEYAIIDENEQKIDEEQATEFQQEQFSTEVEQKQHPTEVVHMTETRAEREVEIPVTIQRYEKVVEPFSEPIRDIVKAEERHMEKETIIDHLVQNVDVASSTLISTTSSSFKSVKPTIRIEINDKTKKTDDKVIPEERKSRENQTKEEEIVVSSMESIFESNTIVIKEKTKNLDPTVVKHREKLLPNNSETWSYYRKRDQLEFATNETSTIIPEIKQNENRLVIESVDNLSIDEENTNDQQRIKRIMMPKRKVYLERLPQKYHQQRPRQFIQDISNNDHHLPDEHDIVQDLIDQHTKQFGFYRLPKRPLLLPKKISLHSLLGEESHVLANNLQNFPNSRMHLTDLNRNKHLQDIEFVQLLSCLVIRGIQIHKQHERIRPAALSSLWGNDLTQSLSLFTDTLNISRIPLHSTNMHNNLVASKLPPIINMQPSPREMYKYPSEHIIENARSKATKAGININKVLTMQDALASALKSDREPSKGSDLLIHGPNASPIITSLMDVPDPHLTPSDITHAVLCDKLLQSHGAPQSSQYIQKIYRSYPKFLPLLHSRIPHRIIPLIWNDPIIQQLASIMGNKGDDSPIEQTERKKLRLPRHILKFGFRELNDNSNEAVHFLREDQTPRTRRRRIHVHLMIERHEYVKFQWRQMLKTKVVTNADYRTSKINNMSAEFNKAAEDVKKLSKAPSNEEKLQLYGWFKQVNVGDVNTSKPGAFDFEGKAKWDAWNKNKGMSKQEAEQNYIELVKKLQAK